jgi:lauroyl/myristoyl acyltransferase
MLIMPALGYRGYEVNQLALQGNSIWRERERMERKAYRVKYRNIEGNMPVKFINMAGGIFMLREAYKALENNEILLFPSTGRGGRAFQTVNFMKRKALLTSIPFRIALHAGAALLPAFVLCCGEKIFVKFDEPISVDHGSTSQGLLEMYAKVLDSYVERYPEQFLMYIYEMRTKAHWDSHPFFDDYRINDRQPPKA